MTNVKPFPPSSTPSLSDLRYQVRDRMEFIDQVVEEEGTIGRDDLVRKYGISRPQAAKDIALYNELTGWENIWYDPKTKRHIRDDEKFVSIRPD